MADLVKVLPSDTNERKRIAKSIQEYVDAKIQMEAYKELMGNVLDTEKNDHGIDRSTFKAWAELAFDQQYNESKMTTKIEESAEKLAEVEILLGGK